MMNSKKIKKQIKKKLKGFWGKDHFGKRASRYAYIFLVVFALSYAMLIWGIGEKMRLAQEPEKQVLPKISRAEKRLNSLAEGHPIEKMVPYISKKDKNVAAYIMAIAKKESNWGLFAPQKDGRDCFNYWGYRGTYNQTESGYSCFDSPRQAINIIGGRIEDLMAQDIDTPKEMVVWKCGFTCRGQNQWQVRKWIRDVDYYIDKTAFELNRDNVEAGKG